MKALVTVVGQDRVGIIGGVCTKLAEFGINILDISQTVMQEFFTMMMIVDLSGAEVSFDVVNQLLEEYGQNQELQIRIQRTDIFDTMHQI